MTYRSLFLSSVIALSSVAAAPVMADWQAPMLVKKSASYRTFQQQIPLLDANRNLTVLWSTDSEFRQSRYDLRFANTSHVWSEGPLGSYSANGDALATMNSAGNVYALWQNSQGVTANYFSPDVGWHQEQVLTGVTTEPKTFSATITQQSEIFASWPINGDSETKEYRILTSRYTAENGWSVAQEIARNPLNISQTIRPKIAVNNNRQAVVAWEEIEFDEATQQYLGQIWVSLYNPATNVWSAPAQIKAGLTHISTDSAPIQVKMDGAGNAYVFYDLYAARYCVACAEGSRWTETKLADAGPDLNPLVPPIFRSGIDAQNNVITIWTELVKAGDFYYQRLFARRFDIATSSWQAKRRLDADNAHSISLDLSAPVLSVLKNGNAIVSWVQPQAVESEDINFLWTAVYKGGWSSATSFENGSVGNLKIASSLNDKTALVWLATAGGSTSLKAKVFDSNFSAATTNVIYLSIASSDPSPILMPAFAANQDDFVVGLRDSVTEPDPDSGWREREQLKAIVYQGDYAAPAVAACDGEPDPFETLTNSSVTGADPSSMQYSDELTVSGLGNGCLTQITIDRGAYSKNGQDYVSTPAYVKNGDRVRVHLQSPVNYGDGVLVQSLTAKLVIGDQADYFTVANKLRPSQSGGDTSPDVFSIGALNNVPPLSEHESESISIAGINAPTPISIENGLYKIGESDWQSSPGYITPIDNQVPAISVKLVASELYSTSKTATLHVGNKSADFVVTTMPSDGNSNVQPQAELKIENAQLNKVYSATWKVSGLRTSAALSVINGQFAVNDSDFSSAPKVVQNDDMVTLRHISAASYESSTSSTLMLGNLPWAKITSVTAAIDASVQAFALKFKQTAGIAPGATVNSYVIIVEGINTPVPINVTNALYSINGGAFTAKPGSVSFHDMVTLQVTMPERNGAEVYPSVEIGSAQSSAKLTTQTAGGEPTPPVDGDGDGRSTTGNNPVNSGGGGGGALSSAMALLLFGLAGRRRLR